MTDQLDVEALVGRLREVPRGEGHSIPVDRDGILCRRVTPYGNMMNEAADALEALAAHIAGEDVRVAAAVAARDAEWSGVASRLNKSVAGLESAVRETPSAQGMPPIPDGYVLVPREPTKAMLEAVDDEDGDKYVARGRALSAWAAMIDAASKTRP